MLVGLFSQSLRWGGGGEGRAVDCHRLFLDEEVVAQLIALDMFNSFDTFFYKVQTVREQLATIFVARQMWA